MASFKSAVLLVLENEGGYALVPGDLGGETYCGISRRYHPSWPGWTVIDNIKNYAREGGVIHNGEVGLVDLELVMRFYREEFWDKIKGDQIKSQVLANQVFDHAVTSGPGDAAKLLQLTVGVKVDGVVGPKTIEAANASTDRDKRAALKRMFKLRTCFYLEAAEKSLSQEGFLPGWVARTLKCYTG